jgi:Glucose/sorbosone dehydrogenases
MNRRQFLALGTAAGLAGLSGCTFSRAVESQQDDGVTIGLETVVEGLTLPTGMEFLPDGSRLIAERAGELRRHTDSGLDETPFLALGDRLDGTEGEKGLVGMALHPGFESNRRLFLRYSAPTTDPNLSHTAVLSEFQVREDLTGVVAGSEQRVLEVPQPGPVHNAGALTFDENGHLFVALGDGQRTDVGEENGLWWYQQGGAAQNPEASLRGGILRIDVDDSEGDRAYGIPSENPLVGQDGHDEFYAWGLRNPYRISTGRLSSGEERLFIGDVGEHIREAVYLGEAGANYGWPMIEGSSCGASTSIGHSVSENPLNALNPKTWVAQVNRISSVKVCPGTESTDGDITQPIAEYNRSGARAVTGGYVYRGDAIPELSGAYLFGDYIPQAPVFALREPDSDSDDRPWPVTELEVADTESGRLNEFLASFARDPAGELYVLTTRSPANGPGRVRRLTSQS